jgi:hypothetical protein
MNSKGMLLATTMMGVGLLCSVMAQEAASAETCNRAYLKGFVDAYFDALVKHDPSKLAVSPSVKFTENGKQIRLGEGLWKTAGEPTFKLEIYDPETCGAAVEAVLKENNNLITFFLRLKVVDQKISEVETLVCRKGDSPVWDPEKLTELTANFTRTIRPAERDSRYDLMAAADAYWRAMETMGTPDYYRPPLLPDTERRENGLRTTNVPFKGKEPNTATQQFDEVAFPKARIYDRRYPVVDEERGIVVSIVRFGSKTPEKTKPAGAKGPFVAEFFAVTSGKIREIHAVLVDIPHSNPTGW